MRLPIVSLALVAVALLGDTLPTAAQSAVSAYPWCLERGAAGPRSCYYSSYEQCRYEAFTNGGFCIQSPYYRGPAGSSGRSPGHPRRHRNS
jgi:hypothetical protein